MSEGVSEVLGAYLVEFRWLLVFIWLIFGSLD